MPQATLAHPTQSTHVSPTFENSLAIETDDFSVQSFPETQTICFRGGLQLCGMDAYAPVMTLLDDAIRQNPSSLCLDLRELRFLNSSGIYMLLRFVLKVRNQGKIQLVVKGSEQIFWQKRSLRSLQQIMPRLNLQWA